jgi:hypothetical protein
LLLERVVVTVVGTSEQVAVRLEWAGGHAQDHMCHRALQNQPLMGASKPATILTGFGHVG